MNLSTPIKDINKIAASLAPKFKKLGLTTTQDLLFYYPYRYDDYSHLLSIADLQPNILTTIKAKIELINSRRSWHKKMLLTDCLVSDNTGQIKIIWFNQKFVSKILNIGDELYISGKTTLTDSGLEFHNPNFEKIGKFDKSTIHTNRLVPIYSSTEKLSQKQIRFILKNIIKLASYVPEWLPPEIIKQEQLFSLSQALHQIHFPISKENLTAAQRRLKFDEIFLLQLRAGIIKQELLQLKSPQIKFNESATKNFVKELPFQMTPNQKRAAWEIIQDLGKNQPMNRLLEGDVGSGKTITAGLALLNVLLDQKQVAYMAPTEILAQQHYQTFCNFFSKEKFTIALLTSSDLKINNFKDKIKKNDLIKAISSGKIDFVIGTHTLIQSKISFKKLALVIIDEQHRFGVAQRQALKQKSGFEKTPHLLSMTATPIPRSLALTLYGELDISIISEMPQERRPIKTQVVSPEKRVTAYQFIRDQITAGRQIFVVCPLIDPSDKLGAKAVSEEFLKLDQKIFPHYQIGLLHGRLKTAEKESIMKKFLDNQIQILVSTPVIEVGIDIPNATVMMIESAERFGLAQLHQLRGRVGRSYHQSYCFLFTESESAATLQRMHTMITAKNGFELAEADLEFRGPGEIYGIKQSGHNDLLKIAKLTDWPLIKTCEPWVKKILGQNPELKNYPQIKTKLTTFETSIHFE